MALSKEKSMDFNGLEIEASQFTGLVNGAISSAVATPVTITATSGSLPTANGSVTIANAASPTVAELQEAVVEINTKLTALLAAID
jgi:F0F1-type ATP synthase epsilon subunit